MRARAAALAFALALSPARLDAQDVVLTISVSSADVHLGPSIGTPVIGHVSNGAVVPVLRDLGSWVKVDWPAGPDGFGYLHVTTGRLGPRKSADATVSKAPRATSSPGAPAPSAIPISASASPTAQGAKPRRRSRDRVVIHTQQDATPITHVVGIGGLFGSMSSVGATSRVWHDNRLGVQIGFTRDAMTSSAAAGHVTSVQLEPAVVYGLFDRVTDYFWIRPYVGGGIGIRHQTLHDATPAGAATGSTGAAFRAFGGTEVTFAGAPRFALSVDAGYRRSPTPFPGFEPPRFTAYISGHWYVK